MILKSVGLMTALNVSRGLVALALSLIVARLVSPSEFAVVAFAVPLMALMTLLTDLGLAAAIVREPRLDKADAGACMTVTLLLGIASGLLLSVLAEPIEVLSSIPGLSTVLVGFGIVAALQISASGPRALLERRIAFTSVALVEFGALTTAVLAFCLCAGVWQLSPVLALVAFHIALQGLRAVAFWFAAWGDFEHRLVVHGALRLVQASSWIFVTNIFNYSARNSDRFFVGVSIGAAALGIYSVAQQVMLIPLMALAWPASGVLMSVVSRIGSDDRVRAGVIYAFVMFTATIVFPVMVYIALFSEYPIGVLFSERWVGLETLISILAPVSALQSIAVYSSTILISRGRFKLNFALGALNGVTLTLVPLLLVNEGLIALAIGYAIAASLLSVAFIYFLLRAESIAFSRFCEMLVPGVTTTVSGLIGAGMAIGFLSEVTAWKWVFTTVGYFSGVTISILLFRKKFTSGLSLLTAAIRPIQVQHPR